MLVILYVVIRSESVISVWAVRSMAFLYFYENSHLICCIFQSHFALSKYRKTAMKFVFRFSFYYLTGVTLCNKWLSYVSLPLYLVVRNVITVILDAHESFYSTQHFCYF